MNGWEIVASFAFGLLVNEMTDVSPWAARKLVRWAAYRWTVDPDLAAGYAEEWTAIIDERPGKLLKLLTAVQFSIGAAGRAAPRMLSSARDRALRSLAERGKPTGEGASDAQIRGAGLGLIAAVLITVPVIYAGRLNATPSLIALSLLCGLAAVVTITIAHTIHRRSRRYRRMRRRGHRASPPVHAGRSGPNRLS